VSLKAVKPLGSRPRRSYSSGLILAAYLAPGFITIGNITEADGRRWRADLLDESVSPVTTAKAYRLLKSILATAVEDSLIRRNPCRVKGAGNGESPERPLLTVAEVYSLADACGHRYRAMILLACFGGLRWGELVALRRRDIVDERPCSQGAHRGIVLGAVAQPPVSDVRSPEPGRHR
jgi:integrase